MSTARRIVFGPPQARVVGVEGARHLWVGESYVRRVLDEIVATVRPGAGPLPTTWDEGDGEDPIFAR